MPTKVQAITFEIEHQLYGINILLLDEILPMLEVQSIPKGPQFLEGVINLRGDIVPVIVLRTYFGYSKKEFSSDSRILISRFYSRKLGFIIDGARNILEFEQNQIDPSVVEGTAAGFIKEIARLDSGQIVQFISISEVLDKSSLNQLSKF